jgi:hypothetical protein
MALQIKAKHKVCNINMLRGFVANYDRFSAKDGPRLGYAVVHAPPMPYRLLKLAEVYG